jgi:hypothetical protein
MAPYLFQSSYCSSFVVLGRCKTNFSKNFDYVAHVVSWAIFILFVFMFYLCYNLDMNSFLTARYWKFAIIVVLMTISTISINTFASNDIKVDSLISPLIAADFDFKNFAQFVIGIILALLASILWVVSRLLSFIFKLIGGIMYGFFVNNPLDTELQYIKPIWSFLVDFGNLLVIGSFLALAIVFLTGQKMKGLNGDLNTFLTGIIMVAILLNFSLTITSAIVTTIHNIGIGSVYITLTPESSAKIDLSSRKAFNDSIRKSGEKFFDVINGNFVDGVSCMGNGLIPYATGAKTMSEVCDFHKKDAKGTLNPLSIMSSVDGSDQALKFFLTAFVRELAVIILLGVGIWVLITLLKVSVFRLAYLWLVGIFSGPALVASVSPFASVQKFFAIWVKWLFTFSTMMIIFVYGFYLSSYISTIVPDNALISFEQLPDPLGNPQAFITAIVNSFIGVVVPNIMFPIVSLAMLYLLGKYLDETYQSHAESALKAGGKMIGNARDNVTNAGKQIAGGVGNVLSAPQRATSGLRRTAANIQNTVAAGMGMAGFDRTAENMRMRSAAMIGKASIAEQNMKNKKQAVQDFLAGKGLKKDAAYSEYVGKLNNKDALEGMGADFKQIEDDARKAGVTPQMIARAKLAAQEMNKSGLSADQAVAKRGLAKKYNKNFQEDFTKTKDDMIKVADENIDRNNKAKIDELEQEKRRFDEKMAGYNQQLADAMMLPDTDSSKNKLVTSAQNRISGEEGLNQKRKDDIDARYQKTEETLTQMKTSIQSDTDSVVTDAVNSKFITNNEDAKSKIALEVGRDTSVNNQNSTGRIVGNQDQAKEKLTIDEANSRAMYLAMRAIDDDTTINKTDKDRQKKSLLSSASPRVRNGAQKQYESYYKDPTES